MNTPTSNGDAEGDDVTEPPDDSITVPTEAVGEIVVPDVPPLSAVMANTLGELVDAVAATDRMLATVSAWRAEVIDQLRQWSEVSVPATPGPAGWDARTIAHRTVVTELACALRLPERTSETLLAESQALLHELPATREALRVGEISYRHARVIIDQAASLQDAARGEFEEQVLPAAKALTVAKFERKARIVRELIDSSTITARHVKSVADRSVMVQPGRDGMAWLTAHLSAENAFGIYNRISQIATGLQGPAEERTLTQLRTDVFSDLLIDGTTLGSDAGPDATAGGTGSEASGSGTGIGRGIRATVLVTVPVLNLLGQSEEPASLEGYGPIDADTARRLAAHAPSFIRILTHPETGVALSLGRDHYAVPKDLRTWLRVRDGTCRFPGCNKSAGGCDIDHTLDWQYGGLTEYDNLADLCPGHHGLKHHTNWTVKNSPDGTLTWTAPSGKRYTTEPETRIEPPKRDTSPEPPPF